MTQHIDPNLIDDIIERADLLGGSYQENRRTPVIAKFSRSKFGQQALSQPSNKISIYLNLSTATYVYRACKCACMLKAE